MKFLKAHVIAGGTIPMYRTAKGATAVVVANIGGDSKTAAKPVTVATFDFDTRAAMRKWVQLAKNVKQFQA